MIISRTPHRISFFGGGTDYPSWYLKYGGKVLGAAIDKYCYILCRELPPFFAYKHSIAYSIIEHINHLDEIQHPSVRETLRYLEITKGLEIHIHTDIPARSGMGSSSAFTVGLLNALYALQNRIVSREQLFTEAIHIEQDRIKENVGSQDQTLVASGGINTVEFLQNGKIIPRPVIMSEGNLRAFQSKFMLFFSGISRNASDVAKDQVENTSRNLHELNAMRALVDQALRIITSPEGGLDDFGRLLDETWQRKKRLSSRITTPDIDRMYATAIKNGALGGKLLGAGGGGFMLFYVNEQDHLRVRDALKGYLHIPFCFDFSGTEIIVYRPEYNKI
jgi:D-glycero-alpha-D-manno-heptose-7-phosphate kinase